jgi:peptidoglycan hydrolase CwlO-like protein
MKRSLLSVVIAGVFVVTTIPSTIQVSAAPSNQQVEESRNKFEELKAKVNEISEKVQAFDNQISELSVEVKENNNKLDNINAEVESANKEIDQAKADISTKEKMLGKRLRAVYKSGGDTDYISLVCSSSSLGDLITKINTAIKLVDTDKKIVKDLSDNKSKLDEKVDLLETKAEEIKKLNDEIEGQKEQLNQKKEEEQKIVDQAKVETEEFSKEYLIPMEREVAQGFMDVANNENSSIEELDNGISALKAISGQTKSEVVKNEISSAIEKGENTRRSKQKLLETVITNRSIVPVQSEKARALLDYAYKLLGKQYVYGAEGPDTFDCSGFTQYVYRNSLGIAIGRTTDDQINEGIEVAQSDLQAGDLVFPKDNNHVTIYIGNGQVIHAPQTGDVVKISSMWSFWRARRILK